MKITAIETLRLDEHPNLLLVQVHAGDDLVGLGETFFGAEAVESYIHETAAPYLIGRDSGQIESHARALSGYLGYSSTGAEMRGNSALDIALWDLLGKETGLPLVQLLGGSSQELVPVYNTCAGYTYVQQENRQSVDNYGVNAPTIDRPYEDLHAFRTEAGALAQSLLNMGIRGMKIWPFDEAAERNAGHSISNHELDKCLEPFRQIREAVGQDIDVMAELHGMWDVPTARKIVRALDEFNLAWIEDPVRGDPSAIAAVATATTTTLATGETLAGVRNYLDLARDRAAGLLIIDASWVGGVSEARKIAAVADAHQLPVALHDCTGPVVLATSTHLSAHLSNAYVQETVRAFWSGWYSDIVVSGPVVSDGLIAPTPGPGHGLTLRPDLSDRLTVRRRLTGTDTRIPVANA